MITPGNKIIEKISYIVSKSSDDNTSRDHYKQNILNIRDKLNSNTLEKNLEKKRWSEKVVWY